jgi:hypothetical protein
MVSRPQAAPSRDPVTGATLHRPSIATIDLRPVPPLLMISTL